MRVQMMGLCRFSYVGGHGFQVDHGGIEARRAFLYDPVRLARRWFWFEHVCLPAFIAQTDPDFTLVVMTGPDLPEPYLTRLRELTSIIPQLRLTLLPPHPEHLDACYEAISPHIDAAADVVGHFRQDDDDAVAVDFIQKARRDFAATKMLWRRSKRLSCDYPRGFVVNAKQADIQIEQRMIYNATAGLVIFLPPDAQRTVIHYPHFKVTTLMPGIVMSGRPMFVRVLSGDNDSGDVGLGYALPLKQPDVEPQLAERFRIDLEAIREGWPALSALQTPAAPRPGRRRKS